jgi:hypothetical protein
MVADARCVGQRMSCILIMTYRGQRAERLLPRRMFNFFARGTIWKNAIASYKLINNLGAAAAFY